jgi:hypothetical protein
LTHCNLTLFLLLLLLLSLLQTLLDDPQLPGYQPALPRGFSLEDLAREVEAEEQERARRRRSPF